MALPKKTTTKKPDRSGRTVTLGRGFSIETGSGEWAKSSVAVTGPADEVEDIREQLSELASTEVAASIDQLREFSFGAADDSETAEDDAELSDEEGEDEGEDDIGPDQVNEMDRKTLVDLIKANELEIDPKDHPNNPKGLKTLRAAVIEAAFSEDEDAGDEEEAEEEAADEEEADEEAEISIDDINAMDRATLLALIEQNELDVDPKKLPKLADLKKATIAAIEASEEEEEEAEEEAEDEEAEEAYTRESLSKMSVADLKAIYNDWDMGKFPAGSPPAAKKLAISAILKTQAG